MDRKQILGIVLIFLIIIGYGIISQPSKKELERNRRIRDSIATVLASKKTDTLEKKTKNTATDTTVSIKNLPDSLKQKKAVGLYGVFAGAATGTKQFYTLENELVKISISSLGGRIYSVELKKYKNFKNEPLILFDGDSIVFGFDFFSSNKRISTNDLYFSALQPADYKTDNNQKISMRLNVGEDKYLEYVYSLEPGSYMVGFDFNLHNMNDVIASNINYLSLNWSYSVKNQEKGRQFERDNSSIYYKFFEDEVNNLNERSEKAQEKLVTQIKWIAFKQQFFSSVLIAGQSFLNGEIKSQRRSDTNPYLKDYSAQLSIPYDGRPLLSFPMKFYFGPNSYKTLKSFNLDLEKLVPLGWGIFGWINRWVVIPTFNLLGSFISNFGIIILILTLLLKLVLFPLTYKSYLSTAKMRVLKPEVDEINKKFPKEKALERQQAVMAMYKKAGVNPLGGCLPVALQMPILIAMFRFFPTSIELRHQPFLWANDLSSYDSIINLPFNIPWYGNHVSLFCLLMTISTIIYTRISQGQMADTSSQMPGMKWMMYFFPVMMLFWFNSYASGLSYYYLLANLMSFGQMAIIKRFVDDDEIMRRIHENKKKPVKKSNFQARLEKMAKERGYKMPKK
ncbi:MAG: membrane protein insertase YidC [Bacteroidia bacterium]|nr:membrane protein insertase YidC [Bacteroidia bacterium]